MRKLFVIGGFLASIVAAVGLMTKPTATVTPVQAAAIQNQMVVAQRSTPSPMSFATSTPDARLSAEMTLLFIHATDTQISIAKTEQAFYDMQSTKAEEQRIQAEQAAAWTQQAQWAMTQTATQVQGMQTVNAGYAFATQTVQATQTSGIQTAGAGATSTAIAATQVIERDKLRAARFGIWGGVALLIGLGVLGLLALAAYVAVHIYNKYLDGKGRFIQDSKIAPDKDGRFPVLPATAIGNDTKLINPNLTVRAVTDPNKDDLTTEQALQNTESNRQLEATRALASSPAFARQVARKATVNTESGMPEANMQISKPQPPLLGHAPTLTPSWSMFQDWDGKGGIPYGASMNDRGMQLELLSLQDVPHGGVFGKTGEGKSRYFLRPFIAGAIAAGHRVVILGKQADFFPFAGHPNVTMIPVRNITQEEEARRYAGYLRRIVEEMNRRDDFLTSRHVSTWDRAGRENTLLILDELGNAIDMMPKSIREEALRWVQGLAKEGRKAGFNVWLATQRAVGFKSIVEQLGRAVFHLADADASRHALGFDGAEKLNHGQFYAKFHRVRQCAAFDPTDDELIRFLEGRPVKQHEPIDWIEGEEVRDTQPVPAAVKPFTPQTWPADEIVQLAESIRAQWEPGMSLNKTSTLLGKPYAGNSWCAKVQEVSAYLTATTTTEKKDPLAA